MMVKVCLQECLDRAATDRNYLFSIELLPVEGQDEGYETVRQNVEDIESSLHAALKQYKKDLG